MDADLEKIDGKLDIVIQKFTDLDKRFVLIEERDKAHKGRLDIHEERHEKSEKFQVKISTERSNIITVAKFCGWIVGLVSVIGGGIAFVIMIINFLAK